MKNRLIGRIERTAFGHRLLKDRRFRLMLFAVVVMGWNLASAVFNGILGVAYRSGWFATMSAYYALLGLLKLNVVSSNRKMADGKARRKTLLTTGVGLLFLAATLAVIVMLTISEAISKTYGSVVMIGIATFTFAIVGNAVISAIKARRQGDPVSIMLRDISLASAVGSVLSLERSMLGTFGSSTDHFTYVMEGASGLAGFLAVGLLGGSMIRRSVKAGKGHSE